MSFDAVTSMSLAEKRQLDTLLPIAFSFASIATIISGWQIYKHLRNYSRPPTQSKIIGILYMIPLYSICSSFSLWIPQYSIYIDLVRDCYEAYALYLFLSLLLAYLGATEDDEYTVSTFLETGPKLYLPYPFKIVFPLELPRGKQFLRLCKFGTMQYCVIKPLSAILAIVLEILGYFEKSNFSTSLGYLYISIVVNMSVLQAFVALLTFYTALKYRLSPFQPIGKFLCIKTVVFFAFWQEMFLSLMVHIGWITDSGDFDAQTKAAVMQNFLVCVEMFLISIAHLHTFSHRPYLPENQLELINTYGAPSGIMKVVTSAHAVNGLRHNKEDEQFQSFPMLHDEIESESENVTSSNDNSNSFRNLVKKKFSKLSRYAYGRGNSLHRNRNSSSSGNKSSHYHELASVGGGAHDSDGDSSDDVEEVELGGASIHFIAAGNTNAQVRDTRSNTHQVHIGTLNEVHKVQGSSSNNEVKSNRGSTKSVDNDNHKRNNWIRVLPLNDSKSEDNISHEPFLNSNVDPEDKNDIETNAPSAPYRLKMNRSYFAGEDPFNRDSSGGIDDKDDNDGRLFSQSGKSKGVVNFDIDNSGSQSMKKEKRKKKTSLLEKHFSAESAVEDFQETFSAMAHKY